jgi:hypothetical protein
MAAGHYEWQQSIHIPVILLIYSIYICIVIIIITPLLTAAEREERGNE